VKALLRRQSNATSEWSHTCCLLQLEKPLSQTVTVTSFPLQSLTCKILKMSKRIHENNSATCMKHVLQKIMCLFSTATETCSPRHDRRKCSRTYIKNKEIPLSLFIQGLLQWASQNWQPIEKIKDKLHHIQQNASKKTLVQDCKTWDISSIQALSRGWC